MVNMRTKLTLKDLSFIVAILLSGCFLICSQDCYANNDTAEQELPGDGSLSDSNILYIGRWDKSNPQTFCSYWTGAYLRVDFTGTSIGIKLEEGTSLLVSIDSETPRGVQGKTGITNLHLSELTDGRHTLLVGAAGQNEELVFSGLLLSAGGTTYPPKSKLLIEYIGDSITAGTGPEGTSAVNYAWNTAEDLGCDHTQIAFSGISLSTDYGCLDQKIGMDSLYFNLKNYNHLDESLMVPWNFTYTPDIIVMALGTNDKCGNADDETVKENAIAFLKRLREKYPATEIAVMRPYNGSYEKSLATAVSEMNAIGDSKMYYFDTTGWLSGEDFSDGTHPNLTGGAKIVERLKPLLLPILQKYIGSNKGIKY